MGRIILYIAQSIDGQIARKDGSVDWLNNYGNPQDYGMNEFMSQIGTIVWGSKTYEQTLGFGDWMRRAPYISCALLILLAGWMAWSGFHALYGSHSH